MQALTPFDQHDVGIVITCTLVFTAFDPAGASAVLVVMPTGGPDSAPRAMSLVGAVATYATVAGDFAAGVYRAEVRVTKAGVTITSEEFLIQVDP